VQKRGDGKGSETKGEEIVWLEVSRRWNVRSRCVCGTVQWGYMNVGQRAQLIVLGL